MPITFDHAQTSINQLVKHFQTNLTLYRASTYKEAQARQEFIDKMFVYLGWDVYNEERAAPQYREVEVEPTQDVEGEKRAPDYVFRIGSERKFFVEAKKPGVSIKSDARPAYQVRRYAWSAKLPLSLLTDFEELAVYDCRTRPSAKDQPSVARINFYTFDQYPDRWREIWDVFSREAVRGGSFDQYSEQAKGKRGTATVDAEFLKEIEGWRDALARNLALRNPKLSIDELNDAVQRTIDRIIFLRMAEDRGIEAPDRLQQASEQPGIYAQLLHLFQQADAKYNSGLFDFAADQLTGKLSIDDKVLKPIIADLYYPNPYEFSVMPTEILGNVYEQFLGKVIRLTAAHQAKVEEKPEVKKAGGVYYTPAYIVAYIVKQTVGKWIEDHVGADPRVRPNGGKHASLPQREPLPPTFRVLDMACGSGSFLLGAYQFLLDYYTRWYIDHEPQKHPKAVTKIGDAWRLTTAERKRILLAHIYGVDIDRQAVEVTKLSLLLKVLEGENQQSLQMELFTRERALPNLDRNIKCGNSLIGPDYFGNQLLPDPDEYRRVNPFDWRREFPDAMKAGGFDCVIGNPPYRKERDSKDLLIDLKKSSYGQKYYQGKMDYWYFFLHRALDLRNKKSGLVSYIVPSYWLSSTGASRLVARVKEESRFVDIVDFGHNKIFGQVSGKHMIFVLGNHGASSELNYQIFNASNLSSASIESTLIAKDSKYSQIETMPSDAIFTPDGKVDFRQNRFSEILAKLSENAFSLESKPVKMFEVSQGIVEAPDSVSAAMAAKTKEESRVGEGVFVIPEAVFHKYSFNSEELKLIKPYLRSQDVKRYRYQHSGYQVFYIGNSENKQIVEHRRRFPAIVEHLDKYRAYITSSNAPYGIHRTRESRFFTAPKLLCRNMFNTPSFTYCDQEYYVNFGFNIVIGHSQEYNLKYLLGILNSKLGAFWFDLRAKKRGVNNDVGVAVLRQFPVCQIDFGDSISKTRHDRMVAVVDKMLALHQQLPAAHTAHDRELTQRQIDATERAIDALVYELYRLTAEEIKIVEA